MLFSKVKADFADSIDIDPLYFISKCITHVYGLKCELQLDSHFNTVTITWLGHRLWKLSSFPRMARSLFKRFVKDMDEHDDDRVDCTDKTTARQVENVSTESLDTRIPPLHGSTPNNHRSGTKLPNSDNTSVPLRYCFLRGLSSGSGTPRLGVWSGTSQAHTLTAGAGVGAVSDTLIASRGNQVAILINKINHMETVIEDLKGP